jgi:hypothetical protein
MEGCSNLHSSWAPQCTDLGTKQSAVAVDDSIQATSRPVQLLTPQPAALLLVACKLMLS